MKICSKCKKIKNESEFCKDRSKECKRKNSIEWYYKHREESIKRAKEWNKNNKERRAKRIRVTYWLRGHSSDSSYLDGDSCCLNCFETNPFVLQNHHLYGRKKSREIITLCANCHEMLRTAPFEEFIRIGEMVGY